MGTTIKLKAADGHEFSVYKAEPSGKPKGAIVVIQEIFGVNDHIRKTADLYASEGYLALAPAIYDRVKPGFDVGYTMPEMQEGFGLKGQIKTEDAMKDIQATVNEAGKAGKVGIVGYCFGGLLTWHSAAKVNGLAAAVPYYGGGMPDVADEKPRVPVMMHFGEKDSYIPLEGVDKLKTKHPDAKVFLYPADHGFNCDQRASFHEPSAKEARQRTLEFFKKHVAEQ